MTIGVGTIFGWGSKIWLKNNHDNQINFMQYMYVFYEKSIHSVECGMGSGEKQKPQKQWRF